VKPKNFQIDESDEFDMYPDSTRKNLVPGPSRNDALKRFYPTVTPHDSKENTMEIIEHIRTPNRSMEGLELATTIGKRSEAGSDRGHNTSLDRTADNEQSLEA
jgi:hypothetical protein